MGDHHSAALAADVALQSAPISSPQPSLRLFLLPALQQPLQGAGRWKGGEAGEQAAVNALQRLSILTKVAQTSNSRFEVWRLGR